MLFPNGADDGKCFVVATHFTPRYNSYIVYDTFNLGWFCRRLSRAVGIARMIMVLVFVADIHSVCGDFIYETVRNDFVVRLSKYADTFELLFLLIEFPDTLQEKKRKVSQNFYFHLHSSILSSLVEYGCMNNFTHCLGVSIDIKGLIRWRCYAYQ